MSCLEDLEDRLRRIEDERGVIRVLHSYGHSLDYGDEDGFASCFAKDGALEVRTEHPDFPVSRVVGRDALRRFAADHTRAPQLWHKHLVIDPLITVDGDTAHSVAYFAVLLRHNDEAIVRAFGRYDDRLVRVTGVWCIAERIAEIELLRTDMPFFSGGRRD